MVKIIGLFGLLAFSSMNVGTTNASELNAKNGVAQDFVLQQIQHIAIHLFNDTNQSVQFTSEHPDRFPVDKYPSNANGLLRSVSNSFLGLPQQLLYNCNFFIQSHKKEIIFPFHSFW